MGLADSSTNHLATIVNLVKPHFQTLPRNFVVESNKCIIDKPLKKTRKLMWISTNLSVIWNQGPSVAILVMQIINVSPVEILLPPVIAVLTSFGIH